MFLILDLFLKSWFIEAICSNLVLVFLQQNTWSEESTRLNLSCRRLSINSKEDFSTQVKVLSSYFSYSVGETIMLLSISDSAFLFKENMQNNKGMILLILTIDDSKLLSDSIISIQ